MKNREQSAMTNKPNQQIPMKYQKKNGHEYYKETDNVDELYIKDNRGFKRYAKYSNGKEHYGTINNKPIIIYQHNGKIKYAKNEFQDEYYPTDEDGNDIYAVNSKGIAIFAKKSDGEEILPTMRDGRVQRYPIDDSGIQRYPLDGNGKPKYPKDKNGKEIYYLKNPKDQEVIFGKDIHGKEVYAVDENGNQYYPETNKFILRNGIPLYAVSKNNNIIYPVNNNNDEYYFETYEGQKFNQNVDRYARLSTGEEFYPVLAVNNNQIEEYIIAGRYAKNLKSEFYPVDGNGNEYADMTIGLLSDYPITTDNLFIVPEKLGEPHFHNKSQEVNKSNIIGVLYRSNGYRDFLTNVTCTHRRSRRQVSKYKYKQLSCAWPHLLYITLGFLFFIVMLFIFRSIAYEN